MSITRFARVLLIAVCLLLTLPALASAAIYEVDSTGDQEDALPGTAGCLTAAVTCTLRAAIEESNFSTGTRDEIKFLSTVFEGQPADTISPVPALPAIKDPVTINGGNCFGEDGPNSPCAGVDGPSVGSALTVENANGVVIDGMAVTGAQTGINVINSSTEFVARNDWIGVKLGGGDGGNTTGIFLDPDSDGAVIGGVEEVERNLVGYNDGDGLHILGADEVEVLGNYFGVVPDAGAIFIGGNTLAANGKDIEVNSTSVGGFTAEETVIGHALSPSALETPECDGGCNVISGASLTGVDLQGDGAGQNEAPAGQTTILGNYVGLSADGSEVIANGTFDVMAGEADEVTVGGFGEGDINYIAGGQYGIYHEKGEGFAALRNVIGGSPGETAVTPPSSVGIFLYSLGTVEGPLVAGNVILMAAGSGVEARFGGATIVENFIQGGSGGIYTLGLSPAVGNLIAANTIFGALNGILLEGDENDVFANEVILSGGAGIRVKQAGPPSTSPTNGNIIGGDNENSENLIFASGGPAIEIVNLEGSQNEVARNRGSENEGLFIDLRAFEPGTEPNGPNGGVKPPVISVAKKSEAEGSAEPGAKVRVFRKKAAEAGELRSFLGEATAEGSGNWEVSFGTVPGGTRITATQTNENGGTSELAAPATTPPDPPSGCPAVPSQCPPPPPPTKEEKDKTPPKVTINKGPKAKSTSTTAKFKFKSNEGGSKFQCKLDKGKFKKCRSPKTYKKLKPGKHTFQVKATDKAGNVGKPVKRKFTVLP